MFLDESVLCFWMSFFRIWMTVYQTETHLFVAGARGDMLFPQRVSPSWTKRSSAETKLNPLWWGPLGSHDSPRAQTTTFEGIRLLKHNQNSTRRPPERMEKNENWGGRGKKRIFGSPAESVLWRVRRAVRGDFGLGEVWAKFCLLKLRLA